MTRLEELFLRWQDQDLTPQELEEFGQLLETPEARALLMEDFVTTHTIREALRTEAAAEPAARSMDAARPRTRRSVAPPASHSLLRWWKPLLVAVGLLLAAAILLTHGPSEPDGADRQSKQAELKRRKVVEEERIRAEAERKIAEIERRRKTLEEQKTIPGTETATDEEKRKKELAELRRIEEELRAAIARAQQASLPKEGVQEPKPQPGEAKKEPERKGEAPGQTEAAVATLERLEGEATIVTSSGKAPAKVGENLLAGQGLEVSARSQAVLVFADKTKLEVWADTELRELKARGGKRFFVAKGGVRAVVAKQPLREEMIITTPHGEAKVVGTTLRIVVDGNPKKGTKLEVEEGRVELKNLAGKMAEVSSGYYAVAASGGELTPRPGVVPPGLLVGLLGHWRMDDLPGDVAVDASGHGLDGKLMNGATLVKGKVAGALRLNGLNQYVDLGKGLDLHEPYTLALWIKLNVLSNQTIISDHSATSSLCHYAIEVIPSGQVRFIWLQGDQGNQFITQDSLAPGIWYHLAVTKEESGNVKLHVNGKPITTLIRDPKKQAKVTLSNDFGSTSIGRPGDMDKSYTNGLVDDVRAYHRVLEPEEIAILARLGDH